MRLDPILALDLVNGLPLTDYICTINPLYHSAKIAKFGTLLVTYRESVAARHLSALRNRTLHEHPRSMGGAGEWTTALQEQSKGPCPFDYL